MLHKLTDPQRKLAAEKLMDLANLAYAGLVLGQMLEEKFVFKIALLGTMFFIILYFAALNFAAERKQ